MDGKVSFDTPMAAHTYFKVGGPSDALAAPENLEDLAALVRYCVKERLPYRIIGGGTNLLVRDTGVRGIVIRLRKGFDAIGQNAPRKGFTIVTVMAGANMQTLCRFANTNGLAGMNFAVGIPGSVGGGLMMNAGTSIGSLADIVEAITVMDAQGRVDSIARDRLSFAYRQLSWPGLAESEPGCPPIIVKGRLRLREADPVLLKNQARALLENRKKMQPLNASSAGCFFKNPGGDKTAGELIDLAGLKGKTVGFAQVSEKHANFIINRGGATAADILVLRDIVRNIVVKKFNIELETEVKIVGSK